MTCQFASSRTYLGGHSRLVSAQRLYSVAVVLGVALAPGVCPAQARTQIADTGRLSVQATVSKPVAQFGAEKASADARYVADWVARSGDNEGAGFVIVDKKLARVFVFNAQARILGSSPVLLGSALGDDSVPGIGSRPIAQVLPQERTTPAGRFKAERGHNARGEDVVWVDYDAAVSMHRVITTNPAERRLERLATPTVDDNRISYGCINVPASFYETYIRPTFARQTAVVYVLPDVKPVQQVFGEQASQATSAQVPR